VPTDHTVIKWACDLCGDAWTGPEAMHAAAACEATGAPDPLPEGTWVLMNGYANNWDEMTTGGFRLARLRGHRIRNTRWMSTIPSPGPQTHIVDHDMHSPRPINSSAIFPHRPGVLNLSNISGPALHDDRLATLLRDNEVASEFTEMLSSFGVVLDPERVAALADDVYAVLEFGIGVGNRDRPDGMQLPPLSSLTPEMQAAFRAVAATKPATAETWQPRLTAEMEVKHRYFATSGNKALATAQALTGHGETLAERAQRWWAGDDVPLLVQALRWTGGSPTKSGNVGLTLEQRDALRAAGFQVPWPVRHKNTNTINTPAAALKALLGTLDYLEAPLPERKNLFDVDTSIAVASGKGGVGKTTVAAALAKALTKRGKNALVIDLDFHGPSLGHLLGLGDLAITDEGTIIPTALDDGTRAISLSQFLTPSTPVTWRGTAVEGFLLFLGARLDLTGIDTIVFDLPPGTGDVERAVMKYARPDGAVLVTTGSDLSHADCRRAGMFLQHHQVPIVGVVENLSRRTVTTPGGETVELRIFGEEANTVAFTEGLAFHDGFGQRYPAYLGSLPFSSSPDAIAEAPEFIAVVDAAEACEPEKVDPDRITSRTTTLTMTVEPESAKSC
jgi:Mrp family chromosome partitioning ATPase